MLATEPGLLYVKAPAQDLPPYSVAETENMSGGLLPLKIPSDDSLANVVITGPEKIPGYGCSAIAMAWPAWVRYSGEAPVPGDSVGTKSGDTAMVKNQSGFTVLSVNPETSLSLVRPSGGSASAMVCKAVADASGGTISLKRWHSDGSLTGEAFDAVVPS